MPPASTPQTIPLLLRAGFAMCFIGHGAYGVITKAAWLPYFAAVGIDEALAWRLMPWIGTMDIAMGFLVFLWPCRALVAWGAFWCLWTAMLRPLADQGWAEFFERAGNYGVPIAILALIGWKGPWFARLDDPWPRPDDETARRRFAWVLRCATVTLLLGHAGCALHLHKTALAHHYAVFVAPEDTIRVMLAIGWLEVVLAFAVLIRPSPLLLVGICIWKLACESLFLTSGSVAPVFEVIERGGSYIAPLTLAVLLLKYTPHRAPARLLQAAPAT